MDYINVSCTNISNEPDPRSGSTLCQLSDVLILFGGKNQGLINNELWLLDYNLSWTKISALGSYPAPRSSHSVSSQGNFMIVSGGYDAKRNVLSDFWLLERSIDNFIWSQVISIDEIYPPAAAESCILFDFPLVYRIGGYGSKGPINEIWVLDLKKNKFTNVTINGTLEPVSGHGCVLQTEDNHKYIRVFLGYNNEIGKANNNMITLRIINYTFFNINNTVKLTKIKPVSSFSYAMSNYQSQLTLFIIGGIDSDMISSNNISLVSLSTLENNNTDNYIFPIYSSAFSLFSNFIFIFSGSYGFDYSLNTISSSYLYNFSISECNKGFIKNFTTCLKCPAGTYKSDKDTKCESCVPGTYSPIPGATDIIQCIPCEYGYYNNEYSAISCTLCEKGSTCFVGSTSPINYQAILKSTQPSLLEPSTDSTFIYYLLLTYSISIFIYTVLWFIFIKLRIILAIYDIFTASHLERPEEEIYSSEEDKPKYSYIGGYFTGLTILSIIMVLAFNINQYLESNTEETVTLLPSNTLTKKDGLKDESIYIYIEMQSIRGFNCEIFEPIISLSNNHLVISSEPRDHQSQKISICSYKYKLKKSKYFSTGDKIDFKFNCTSCYTSDISIALEGKAAYHDKLSRYVQSLVLKDGKVFVGKDSSMFYFGIIPAIYQDFTSASKRNHYGYRISELIDPTEGSKSSTSRISLSSDINFSILLSLMQNGVYSSKVFQSDLLKFFTILITSVAGVFAFMSFLIKLYQIILYCIKFRKNYYNFPYSIELRRKTETKRKQNSSMIAEAIN